ncbi:hypothetical protein RI129_002546 [Pyrocoelia pectoralis]|uniref:CLIP domain-containing serine protease n=1 Tax=Pyrocoelia pectoralis TaxID=417401 RepID=A0AAN7VP33_9COLE
MKTLWIFLNVAFLCSRSSGFESCRTPEGNLGECKVITQCPHILVLTEKALSHSTIIFLKKSQCGFEGLEPKVCCVEEYHENDSNEDTQPIFVNGGQSNSQIYNNKDAPPTVYESGSKHDAQFSTNLLPNRSVCGTGTENRIFGGEATELDEFPWMTLIGYQKPSGHGFHCGGVLISKRYVLTAAHCIKGRDLPKSWEISDVQLGEYNTETEEDCIIQNGYEFCSDPPMNVKVTEKIAHEMYDPFDQNQYHDIALLRLENDVAFTNFIKPICLPTSEGLLHRNFVGTNMTVAGWGKTETRSESKTKLKLQVPVKSMDDCAPVYNSRNVNLGVGQLCAGGVEGKDSCRGDSGGPLMTLQYVPSDSDYNWYVSGVVSFGPSPCGVAGWPGVYTKVTEYIPWIIKNIKSAGQKQAVCYVLTKLIFYLKGPLPKQYESCYTPTRTPGQCISIRNCAEIIKVLKQRPLTSETAEYLKSAHCGFEGLDAKVCCSLNDKEYTPLSIPDMEMETPKGPITSPLLPDKDDCGQSSSDRIVGGLPADLFDFPWMALIEYRRPDGNGFYCGGSLINKRYILTAAHCLKGRDLPSNWEIVSVRLGEYNLETDTDCVSTPEYNACSDKPVDVPVVERIAHEYYNPFDTNQYNDIALLRLAHDVPTTDYIFPICLPTTSDTSYQGLNMTVAGWGRTETSSQSNLKMKLDVPVKPQQECITTYQAAKVLLKEGQICAGGIKGQDSCTGDSGGPLMFVNQTMLGPTYYVTGIVSFGPSNCGLQNWPGVYTKVVDYIPWIISKLRP